MLRKRIKKNTLKWKKIYAEQLLDIMDEEENALQKIYLTGYVLELKKNRYFAGWYKDRIVCRSLESMHVIFRVLRQRKSMYISIWDLQA